MFKHTPCFACLSLLMMLASATSIQTSNTEASKQESGTETRSFLYGVSSGVALGLIQRLSQLGIVGRYHQYYPVSYFATNESNKRSYKEDNAVFYGTNTGAAIAGACFGEAADKFFKSYGHDFWQGLDPQANRNSLQKGYTYGKFGLSGILAIIFFVSGNNMVSNHIMFNEIGSSGVAIARINFFEYDNNKLSIMGQDCTSWISQNNNNT